MSSATIKLQSYDGEIFTVEMDIARKSITIQTIMADLEIGDKEGDIVPLSDVNGPVLKKVSKIHYP